MRRSVRLYRVFDWPRLLSWLDVEDNLEARLLVDLTDAESHSMSEVRITLGGRDTVASLLHYPRFRL